MKKIIIILSIFVSIQLFAVRMPGAYKEFENSNEMLSDIGLRVEPKNGAFEHYYLELQKESKVKKFLNINIIYSIFYDEKTSGKWLEMTFNGGKWSKNSFKMLYKDKLFKGDISRIMFKMKSYNPFELPLNNINNEKFVDEQFMKIDDKNIKYSYKFIKDDKIKISDKEYSIKVYKDEKNNTEYGVLDDKTTTLFGLAYAKTPRFTMYLKAFGNNAISIFPKKVPVLDLISKLYDMNKSFMKQKEKRKKAKEEEKLIENEGIEKVDDPIKRLDDIMKKEKNK